MAGAAAIPLLIGEVIVDVTITPRGQPQKLRLGGIAHAARGFWASNQQFAIAAILPRYLEQVAQNYLTQFGCVEFITLGYVSGAPNVALIFDPTEVDDQEYDMLLREQKSVELDDTLPASAFKKFTDALVFPGNFDLKAVCELLSSDVNLHIDVAYDVTGCEQLRDLGRTIKTVLLSTSSRLFHVIGSAGIEQVASYFAPLNAEAVILKENRGGSRVHIYAMGRSVEIPAQLASTVNSVGVGDVFAAAYLSHLDHGPEMAAWRATLAASAYAQTTVPAAFARDVARSNLVTLEELRDLGGTVLPWEERQQQQIYLAAPDFTNFDKQAIERAVSALQYHNFRVRRPVQENGELPAGSDGIALARTYRKDVDLLQECKLLFAVPTGRDPGTLVEVGLAIAARMPVVVYDPAKECANTMVIAGSDCYSDDLDTCLNAVFTLLSKLRHSPHV